MEERVVRTVELLLVSLETFWGGVCIERYVC